MTGINLFLNYTYNNTLSKAISEKARIIIIGVPQGSVLEPVFCTSCWQTIYNPYSKFTIAENSHSNIPPHLRSNPICTLHPTRSCLMSHLHQHNIWNATSFVISPPHHLSLHEKKPSYKGAPYYNHLPNNIRKEFITTSKKALTRWLLNRPYYKESTYLIDF